MSFIDYNFFPILFFLGWNILTRPWPGNKQFKPNIYSTTDSKTLPALSVFSLTNFSNQKTNLSNLQHQNKSSILEFVPEFLFLSENPKLIKPSASIICLENQRNQTSMFKNNIFVGPPVKTPVFFEKVLRPPPSKEGRGHIRPLLLSPLKRGKSKRGDKTRVLACQPLGIEGLKNIFVFKHIGLKRDHNWGESILHCSEKSAQNTNAKMRVFKHQKPSKVYRKSVSMFKEIPLNMETDFNNCIVKVTKWFSNREKRSYLTNYNLINNNWKENFKSNIFNLTYRPKTKRLFSSFFPAKALPYKIKPVSSKIELSLNLPSVFFNSPLNVNICKPGELSFFENDIIFQGLCYSQNNAFFWKKTQKQFRSTWFLNKIAYSQATSFLNFFGFAGSPSKHVLEGTNLKNPIQNASIFERQAKDRLIKISRLETDNKNDFNANNSIFQDSSFLSIKADLEKLNSINSIQKRRSKIRLLLRVPSQRIYSLNRFQIALCFSKILQPSIFDNNYGFNLTPKLYNSMFNNVKSPPHSNLFFSPPIPTNWNGEDLKWGRPLKRDQKWKDNKGESSDNTFAKHDQEIAYVDNYNKIKKIWYMKTQFFQHIAWNMKHKLLDSFSDGKWLVDTTSLIYLPTPFKNLNSFVTKPSKTASYQNKQHLFTNNQFWQNYILNIYGGSWYYENLASPYSIFNTSSLTSSSSFQSESIPFWSVGPSRLASYLWGEKKKDLTPKNNAAVSALNGQNKAVDKFGRSPNPEDPLKWKNIFNLVGPAFINREPNTGAKSGISKKKDVSEKQKLLKSKRLAILWFYARQYNLLQNFQDWPYENKLEYDKAYNHLINNLVDDYRDACFLSMTLSNNHLNKIQNKPLAWNYKNDFFSAKKLSRLQSDIGIYSLAHKLSSVGFRNGNSEIDIYPFKYNDSYRYNFQNMNLSNQRLKDFLSFSDFKSSPFLQAFPRTEYYSENQKATQVQSEGSLLKRRRLNNNKTRDASVFSQASPVVSLQAKPEGETQRLNTDVGKKTHFLNFRKFLDVQNPIFSKIYAPLFQPQGVNLLPFLTNSFLEILPNSITNSQFKATVFLNELKNKEASILKRSFNTNIDKTSPKLLKNFNSQLYFTEKPSCIKKPSIFFSSFRHLPYFFMSETLSKKNVIFPKTNLCLLPLVNSYNYQLGETINNLSSDLAIPQCYLFKNHVSQDNEKKQIIKPWKGYLQHKYFSLKPLSTFIKKEVGYETSLFSSILPVNNISLENQTKILINPSLRPLIETSFKPRLSFKMLANGYKESDEVEPNERLYSFPLLDSPHFSPSIPTSVPFLYPQKSPSQWPEKQWFENKEKSILKTYGIPIKKNTWKIFPPLFQPLTFQFIDLNLPRTWSSELISSVLKNTSPGTQKQGPGSACRFSLSETMGPLATFRNPTNKDMFQSSNILKNTEINKKPFSYLPQTKWNMTQKNFFGFSMPFYFSDFFGFSAPFIKGNQQNTLPYFNDFNLEMLNRNYQFDKKSSLLMNNNQKFEKKDGKSMFNETPKFQNSKIIVYSEKPLLKNRTAHGPPLKNQKESISLPSYLKNITNQNYQNLCPNNLNELYFVFWILFNKTLFIYLSLYYLQKFISFLGTEYIRNLFKIFVTMKFIDGNILSIIKTFQDFNFQLNQQNVIDIKVNKQLKNIKRN